MELLEATGDAARVSGFVSVDGGRIHLNGSPIDATIAVLDGSFRPSEAQSCKVHIVEYEGALTDTKVQIHLEGRRKALVPIRDDRSVPEGERRVVKKYFLEGPVYARADLVVTRSWSDNSEFS